MDTLEINLQKTKEISADLYGIFFEDINHGIDGGINNNLVCNPSGQFKLLRYKKDLNYYLRKLGGGFRKKLIKVEADSPLYAWNVSGNGNLSYSKYPFSSKAVTNGFRIEAFGTCYLENYGYNAYQKESFGHDMALNKAQIGLKQGHGYEFIAKVKQGTYVGKISVYVQNRDGEIITEQKELTIVDSIGEYSMAKTALKCFKTGIGRLVVKFSGNGRIYFNDFYFGDEDYWGKGQEKWANCGRLRRDMVEKIADLKPKALRFPGGCIVEGYNLANSYDWKGTVGDVFSRKGKINLWAENQPNGDLFQNFHIGFYEYFLLAEDLKAKPLPIINAGISCQARNNQCIKSDSPEFKRVINDFLELIEFANGTDSSNYFVNLRTQAGHPKPFYIDMVGIGNENFGSDYNDNFNKIKEAILAKYPYMKIVWCAGFDCYKNRNYETNRAYLKDTNCIVDDHFYRGPDWLINNQNMYDDYDRKSNKIYLGEYAANGLSFNKFAKPNNYYGALSEGVYLTGIERNADVVIMSSYAPLFCKVGASQWKHALIPFNNLCVGNSINYYVNKMYSNNVGNKYVENNLNDKEVFSSATLDENNLYIKLVNIARTEKEIKIKLSSNCLAHTTLTSLFSNDDLAVNTLNEDDETPKDVVFPKEKSLGGGQEIVVTIPPRSVNVIKGNIK